MKKRTNKLALVLIISLFVPYTSLATETENSDSIALESTEKSESDSVNVDSQTTSTEKGRVQESQGEKDRDTVDTETDDRQSTEISSSISETINRDVNQEEKMKVTIDQNGTVMELKLDGPLSSNIIIYLHKLLTEQYPEVNVLKMSGQIDSTEEGVGMGEKILSNTDIEEIYMDVEGINPKTNEVTNGFVPAQFYYGGKNKRNKLKKLILSDKIKEIHQSATINISSDGSSADSSSIEVIEAPSVTDLSRGGLDGFKGTELIFPALINAADDLISYNNFYKMPNVERIIMPELLDLAGWELFSDSPNLKEVDMRNLPTLTHSGDLEIFNSGDSQVSVLKVRMDSLKKANKLQVGNIEAKKPIYITVNKELDLNAKSILNNGLMYSGVEKNRTYEIKESESKLISSFGDNEFVRFGEKFNINWYLDGKFLESTNTPDIEINDLKVSGGKHLLTPVVAFKAENDFVEDKENVILEDIEIHIGEKKREPITLKYVYYDDKKVPLKTNSVKEKVYDPKDYPDGFKLTPDDLTSEHFNFVAAYNGEEQMESTEGIFDIEFSDQEQVIYLAYQGESWMSKNRKDLAFKGKLNSSEQLLPVTLADENDIFLAEIKSSELVPNWKLSVKSEPFIEGETSMLSGDLPITLQINGESIGNESTIIHSQKNKEDVELTISNTLKPSGLTNKKIELLVGKDSYKWAKPTVNYSTTLTWTVDSLDEESISHGQALPLKASELNET